MFWLKNKDNIILLRTPIWRPSPRKYCCGTQSNETIMLGSRKFCQRGSKFGGFFNII